MKKKPNILIIYADEHRYDCLGAYGNTDIRTPHIDALAADGVLFENSFCPYPVCTPSRYSLLTGSYAHQHLGILNRSTLPAGLPVLPRLLRDAGYATAAIGKMHFTPTYLDVGFDKMLLAEQCGAGRYDDDYHRWLKAEGLCDRLDLIDQIPEFREQAPAEYWSAYGALRSDLDEAHHSTTWIGDRALEALEQWTGKAQLLMVGFIKPHHPFDPPAPWDAMYDPAALALLPGWTE
ncbi:MAG: sulfatase-like hydrolase/transferase, partial [Kiritimatiellia bacterium]